jgi:CTP:molybdopterin cytidylyltransferase MocA
LSDSRDVTAIVLAAGRSSRFGDRHKALPEPFGVGLLARAAEIFDAIGLVRRLAVTGFRADEVGAEASRLGFKTVENRNFDNGMYSSILTGLSAAGRGPALILPVDASFVRPQSVLAVAGLWRSLSPAERAEAIVVPAHQGRCGHPPLLGAATIQKILGLQADNLRSALSVFFSPETAAAFQRGLAPRTTTFQGPVRFLESPDAGVLTDVDEPADYEKALGQEYSLSSWPNPWEAWSLLELVDPGPLVPAHSLRVARGALRLGLALAAVGLEIDPIKCFIAGIVHDVDRAKKKHEAQAEARLKNLGWPRLARIVGQHKDLAWPPAVDWAPDDLLTAMALYLADKYFLETEFVTLEERFGAKIDSFDNPKAQAKARARLANARKIEAYLQEKLGEDPRNVVGRRSQAEFEELAETLEREAIF